MTDKPEPPKDAPLSARRAARLAREAEALRANLRRRKDQARARAADDAPDATATEDRPGRSSQRA